MCVNMHDSYFNFFLNLWFEKENGNAFINCSGIGIYKFSMKHA